VFNRISRWVASEIVRVTDDAQMRLSMLKRFIDAGALRADRDLQNLHAHVRRLRRPQPVGRQRLKGLWEKLPTKWEKRHARARPALQSQVELGRDARCCAASTKWV
jgi:hypothetical protein